jgi:hypothetical protein
VMGIDVKVAARLHRQVQQPVPAELRKHVVEKRHTGLGPAYSGPVEGKLDQNLSLAGDPADTR